MKRTTWGWRDYPSLLWLVIAGVVAIVHRAIPHAGWLMAHLVLLGALTHAAFVWSTHFTQALLKTAPEVDDRKRQSRRLATLFVGVSLVLVGVVIEVWWPAITGASLVTIAVVWHAAMLWRRLRASIGARFRITVHYYLAAAAWLPIGATLGMLLARGPDDEWHGRMLVGHSMVMALGWIGFTVAGTLVTLWPTMLRARIDPRAETLARQALPIFTVAVAVTLTGALTGQQIVTVAGLAGYLLAALWWGRALWAPLRTRPPGELAPLSVAAALGWAIIAIGWVAGTVALRADWAQVGDTYGVPTAILAAGFAPQLLLGAMSYLVPSVLGGGPAAVRAAQAWVDRWAILRLVVVNGGLILSLLPAPSVVRVLTTGLVLTAYGSFVPLLGLAIRASIRARAEARPADTTETPTARTPRAPLPRRTVWSSGQLVAGFATLSLAVAGGVLADPYAAGFVTTGAPAAAAAPGNVVATGRTTTVRVAAMDMRYEPASISVPAGDRLIIELTNADPTTSHDLVLTNGSRTARLRPGGSETLDVGVVGQSLDGWCSVVGHKQMGMRFEVRVVGTAEPSTAADPGSAHGASGHAGATPAPSPAGHTPPATPVDLHGTFPPGFTAVDATAPSPTADAALAPGTTPQVHRITVTIKEIELQVAPGVWQRRWTFNGAAPGPTLRGRVGDTFEVTLVNDGSMGHSIDFHAGALAPERPMRTIPPGESLLYRFTATRAGIWMYHCSTMPMSAHIAAGMHGAVIIDPPGLPRVDREYVLVQSEVFLGETRTSGQASEVAAAKVAAENPDAVVFNGVAGQYDVQPLPARVGERVRIWVLDAGPNRPTSFHIVGAQFDTVYAEGAWRLRAAPPSPPGTGNPAAPGTPAGPDYPGGSQVLSLAAAEGGFVELTFPEVGRYPFVSHLIVDAERGAHGFIDVTAR